jgi:hypothetical protein
MNRGYPTIGKQDRNQKSAMISGYLLPYSPFVDSNDLDLVFEHAGKRVCGVGGKLITSTPWQFLCFCGCRFP